MKTIMTIVGVIILALAALIGWNVGLEQGPVDLGNVNRANEYQYVQLTGPIATTSAIKTGAGVLGSVVITETHAGAVVLYDATSTAAIGTGLETRVVDIKSALAEDTYTFDVRLKQGLVMVSDDGFSFAGDWTITYR